MHIHAGVGNMYDALGTMMLFSYFVSWMASKGTSRGQVILSLVLQWGTVQFLGLHTYWLISDTKDQTMMHTAWAFILSSLFCTQLITIYLTYRFMLFVRDYRQWKEKKEQQNAVKASPSVGLEVSDNEEEFDIPEMVLEDKK
eukprot:TRINITY_DN9805_c0_g2_i3.p1 TRINITY_DN9805_c0_g2~~TRINITY_DN9805_c0_g2_i3.p1  ORF type:complete len:142 (-),score=32.55 TRINITY_DN9805_c0_g2_i3:107-532(-)